MHKLSVGLIGGGSVALLVSILMGWLGLPHIISRIVKKAARLEEGSVTFKTWQNPTETMEVFLKVYFFNVTNPLGILRGERPSVNEIGPYVYSEKRQKEVIEKDDKSHTIKYRQKLYLYFERAMSTGSNHDRVTFVNIPFVGMVKTTTSLTDSEFILEELDSQLKEKGEGLFRTDSIQNVLLDGFSIRNFLDILEDPITELAVGKVKIPKSFRGGKFAIYKGKNGSDDGLYEVNTGHRSYKELGKILKWNNMTELNWWGGEYCNSIGGTDGTIFPPFLDRNQTLKSFSPEVCRTLSLIYESDIDFNGVPGFRFTPSTQSILGGKQFEPNRCFCVKQDPRVCNRNGLMLLSGCHEGAPVSLSSPHFHDGDQEIIDAIDGIEPIKEKHKTYLDIEPITGVLMRAAKRLQFNVEVYPCKAMSSIAHIRNLVFPVLWAEESSELPTELLKHLVQLVHTQSKVETARWSTVGVSLVCICLGILWVTSVREKLDRIEILR